MDIDSIPEKFRTQANLGKGAYESYAKRTELTKSADEIFKGSEALAAKQLALSTAKPYQPTGLESLFTPVNPLPFSLMEAPTEALERLGAFFTANVLPFVSDDALKILLENFNALPKETLDSAVEAMEKIGAMISKQVEIVDSSDQTTSGRTRFVKG